MFYENMTNIPSDELERSDNFQKEMLNDEWRIMAAKTWKTSHWSEILNKTSFHRKKPFAPAELISLKV
jgi:hypothetical protein